MNKKINNVLLLIVVCFGLLVILFNFFHTWKLIIIDSRRHQDSALVKVPDSVVFAQVYKKMKKLDVVSLSSSAAINTKEYRKLLQTIFDDDRYQSFVEFGCGGDFEIMKLMRVPQHKSYTGIDLVVDVVKENKRLYGNKHHANYLFYHVNDIEELDHNNGLLRGHMLIVKDVLIHFSNKNIHYFIDNILSNFKYALITNDYSDKDEAVKNNIDIVDGQSRPVDLAAPPFNLTNLKVVLQYKNPGHLKRVYLHTNPNITIKYPNFRRIKL